MVDQRKSAQARRQRRDPHTKRFIDEGKSIKTASNEMLEKYTNEKLNQKIDQEVEALTSEYNLSGGFTPVEYVMPMLDTNDRIENDPTTSPYADYVSSTMTRMIEGARFPQNGEDDVPLMQAYFRNDPHIESEEIREKISNYIGESFDGAPIYLDDANSMLRQNINNSYVLKDHQPKPEIEKPIDYTGYQEKPDEDLVTVPPSNASGEEIYQRLTERLDDPDLVHLAEKEYASYHNIRQNAHMRADFIHRIASNVQADQERLNFQSDCCTDMVALSNGKLSDMEWVDDDHWQCSYKHRTRIDLYFRQGASQDQIRLYDRNGCLAFDREYRGVAQNLLDDFEGNLYDEPTYYVSPPEE